MFDCQPDCQPEAVISGPQWSVLTRCVNHEPLVFLILLAGERVGFWPPEPKATGSNPVGRASTNFQFVSMLRVFCWLPRGVCEGLATGVCVNFVQIWRD